MPSRPGDVFIFSASVCICLALKRKDMGEKKKNQMGFACLVFCFLKSHRRFEHSHTGARGAVNDFATDRK